MARKFVSPGVFTQEIDQSFLAAGVGAIGAVVIGRTSKGPAFVPTLVSDFNEFVAKFGDVDPTMMAPYASKNYLKNSNSLTVVRVLGTFDGKSNVSTGATAVPWALTDNSDTMLAEVHVLSGTTFSVTQLSSSAVLAQAYISGVGGGSVVKAQVAGVAGNNLTVEFVSSSAAPSASIAGDAITFYIDPGTTDWDALALEVSASTDVEAAVLLSYSAGTGTPPVTAITHLSGGVDLAYGAVQFQFVGLSGVFTGSFPLASGTFTFDPAANNYIGRVFNTDPTKADKYGHFLYKNFEWASTGSGAPFSLAALSGVADATGFDYEFTSAQTPWIKSQGFGGNKYDLFRFWTLSAGEAANTDVKVSISNIKASAVPGVSKYGTFDIDVRSFSDIDSRMAQVETFTNVTLDPTSPNYLPRVIGDQYKVWNSTSRKIEINGTYKNYSKYIRVEMPVGVDSPAEALPWGHEGYVENVTNSGRVKDVPYVQDNLDSQGNYAGYVYFGLDFTQDGIADRLKAGTNPLDSNSVYVQGADFDMSHLSSSVVDGVTYQTYNTGYSASVPSTDAVNGFTVAFFGGWDGFDLTQADPLGNINSGAMTPIARISTKLAVDAISNPDEIDLNLVAVPGVTDPTVTSYVRQMCNTRADCMMIMDIEGSSVNAAISALNTQGIDDNYAATYYPDLRYSDTTNNVLVRVKPSVAVLGAYAYSDRVGQVFFAPAGLNRGGLAQFGIVDVMDRLTFQDRNDLYENRINPIAIFPNEGINVFGQKTLQYKPSALDRVNVRRLLIYAKKTIASAARYLLFEPNNPATWQRFLNTVNPILENVKLNQGLERFKVVMDSTTNTPDLIDRNIMTGKIFLQPTKAAEYIDLSFIITASGVQFEE